MRYSSNTQANYFLITFTILFTILFLAIPVFTVLIEGFSIGIKGFQELLDSTEVISSIYLTIKVVIITTLINLFAAFWIAWAISKFNFYGKSFLINMIDTPLSISPVIVGLIFLVIFNDDAVFAKIFPNINVLFALPSIIIVSLFVTLPIITKEIITAFEQAGTREEESAIIIGANKWQMLFRISIPNIKTGLIYGTLLCAARCAGEYGAVSIVSGHIRSETTTIPLQVEMLYSEYMLEKAFALSSLLVIFSIVGIAIKKLKYT